LTDWQQRDPVQLFGTGFRPVHDDCSSSNGLADIAQEHNTTQWSRSSEYLWTLCPSP